MAIIAFQSRFSQTSMRVFQDLISSFGMTRQAVRMTRYDLLVIR